MSLPSQVSVDFQNTRAYILSLIAVLEHRFHADFRADIFDL
jgi:hypothetical protein